MASMLNNSEIHSLYQLVLGGAFFSALVLGYVLQKTNFCTMGAISDLILMGSATRLRQWLFAIAVSVLGFGLFHYFGLIKTQDAIYTAPKVLWLSTLLGSTMFGFGMVLASGCGGRNLIRIGSGSLRALVVMVLVGVFGQMTLRGVFGVVRVNTTDLVFFTLPTQQDLPSILAYFLGIDTSLIALLTAIVVFLCIMTYIAQDKDFFNFNNIQAGLFVGLAIIALWFVSGSLGYVEEDPNTLAQVYLATNTGRIEAASFVAPVSYTLDYLSFFSDSSKKLTIGVMLVLGMILGAFICAKVHGLMKWQGFNGLEDTANHLVGAACMGVGGVMAMGCTIGQGLSGISTLSLSAMIALGGFFLGAYLALRYLEKRI